MTKRPFGRFFVSVFGMTEHTLKKLKCKKGKRFNRFYTNEHLFKACLLACRAIAKRRGIERRQAEDVVSDMLVRTLGRMRNFFPKTTTLKSYAMFSATFAWCDYWRAYQKRLDKGLEAHTVPIEALDSEQSEEHPIEIWPGFQEVDDRLDAEITDEQLTDWSASKRKPKKQRPKRKSKIK